MKKQNKIERSLIDSAESLDKVSLETLSIVQLRQRCRALENQLERAILDHQRTKLFLAQYEAKNWCPHCEKKVKLTLKLSGALCKECRKFIRN